MRKYIIQNEYILLLPDVYVLTLFIALLFINKIPCCFTTPFFISSTLFLLWSLINFVLLFPNEYNIFIFLNGIRTVYLPFFILWTAAAFFEFPDALVIRTARVLLVALVAMTLFSLLQLFLGEEHPLNQNYGSAVIGVYYNFDGSAEVGERILFRATSIFMHTGQFGQVIFIICVYYFIFCCEYQRSRLSSQIVVFLTAVLALLLSGQRATLLFAILSCTAYLLLAFRGSYKALICRGVNLFFGVVVTGLVMATALSVLGLGEQLESPISAAIGRFSSTLAHAGEMTEVQIARPISQVIEEHLFFGYGLGFFSFGSQEYGGGGGGSQLIYWGLHEGTWLRLCAEVGVIGALLYTFMIAAVILQAFRNARSQELVGKRVSAAFLCFWLMFLCFWSFTHDVFGNVLVMIIGSILGGAGIIAPAYRKLSYRRCRL